MNESGSTLTEKSHAFSLSGAEIVQWRRTGDFVVLLGRNIFQTFSRMADSDVEMLEEVEGQEVKVQNKEDQEFRDEGEGSGETKIVSPTTPASKVSHGGVGESPKTPTSSLSASAKKRKRMTPDERLKMEEEREQKRRRLQEEKAKKEEEKRKKEQERLDKLEKLKQEKAEKERQREAERLERERQKEQERLKKEEERKEREKQKEQERLKKEEELAKKAEEKRKKEEEKARELEEKERERKQKELEKKKKAGITAGAVAFMQNFVKKLPSAPQPKEYNAETGSRRTSEGDPESDKENSNSGMGEEIGKVGVEEVKQEVVEVSPANEYEEIQVVGELKQKVSKFCPFPFQIKTNMVLAPILRRKALTEEEKSVVDEALAKNEVDGGTADVTENVGRKEWIERVKRKEMRKSERTLIEEEVKIVMEDVIKQSEGYIRHRIKLLQFDENKRPAYWGTYKKKPAKVTPVNPWVKEEGLDYEFDSDDEWEDEPEDAEEIENSDGEEEAEDPTEGEPVDEEDEEGWMVPHGYLSDSENEGEVMDIETVKLREKEFYKSLKDQIKMGIPVIQTERLVDFKMIFPPKKVRKSSRRRVEATADVQQCSKGFLALALPSDDEDDKDWTEDEGMEMELSDNEKTAVQGASMNNEKDDLGESSDIESESSSDDSDMEFEDDDEEDLKMEKEEHSSRVKSSA